MAMLRGKVAVVTGVATSATSTLGKAIAKKFVEHGARVILADQSPESCQVLATEINNTKQLNNTEGQAHWMDKVCNISDRSGIEAAVQAAEERFSDKVDIFYNNEAVQNAYSSNSCINMTSFTNTMKVNVQSVIASIEHAGDVMRKHKKGGVILCTGSILGLQGDVVPSAYSISKAAVISVVRAAAAELGRDRVRVNAISPYGFLGTFDEVVLRKMFPKAAETSLQDLITSCRTNNEVMADHMANAAVFLASDLGKGITGQNLVLNGEFTP